jgi:hypothetical protein
MKPPVAEANGDCGVGALSSPYASTVDEGTAASREANNSIFGDSCKNNQANRSAEEVAGSGDRMDAFAGPCLN